MCIRHRACVQDGRRDEHGQCGFCRNKRSHLVYLHSFRLCHLADGCIAQTLRGPSALNCLGLWSLSAFLNNLQLWDPNFLLHDLKMWNLHNRVINHLVNTLQLWNLHGLLNSLDHGDLSLHSDGHFINLVRELHLRNLNVLDHLVVLLIDHGLLSLHCLLDDFGHLCFNCVDDVLNMRVRNLLRLFLRPNDRRLNDHLNE